VFQFSSNSQPDDGTVELHSPNGASVTFIAAASSISSQSINWWYTPLMSGVFALTGVLIAQGVVLRLARRNELRRSEPELLKHCAAFSAACGQIKREIALKASGERDLSVIELLQSSFDAIEIIGTPEIESAAEKFIGAIPMILHYEEAGAKRDLVEEAKTELFQAHMKFVASVRAHFGRPEKIHVAVPMLEVPKKGPSAGDARTNSQSGRNPVSKRAPRAPR
jgi:hypothetical protein